MKALLPLVLVLGLALVAFVGAGVGLAFVFGIVVPYLAMALFVGGFTWRVVRWARSPVPFRIPTPTGQARSLPWIKSDPLESPSSALGVVGRVALEVLFFRSLFRNSKAELRGDRLTYSGAQFLWLAGLAFHWSFLIVFVRHYRFFTEPVPSFVTAIQSVDGMFQLGVPPLYLSGVIMLAAVTALFLRRVVIPQVRYISLPSDYFPLFLLMGIALSGGLLRHLFRVDLVAVKELAIGLVTFQPVLPQGVNPLFYVHLFLVSTLFAYFPASKLMHMGGVFLSPTRNLPNNSRMVRHVNAWDYPVEAHTYAQWQDEFKDKIVAAGLPLDEEASEPREALVQGGRDG